MKHAYIILSSFFIVFFCAYCKKTDNWEFKNELGTACAKKIELKYATKFSVDSAFWGYRIQIKPYESAPIEQEIFLVRNEKNLSHIPRMGKAKSVINIPIKKLATNSTTHTEFVRLLGEDASIRALCCSDYIYNDSIYKRVKSGEIVELGGDMQVNREKLLLSNPDVLFLSDKREFAQNSPCPIIISYEWCENTALGRAEWIKFFSLFFDKIHEAEEIFNQTEDNYQRLKNVAQKDSIRPRVFAAGAYGDTWYLTGGLGYMAKIYEDANCSFCLKDTMVGTVTCGLEWLITNFQTADMWMNCHAKHKEELDDRLSAIKAFQDNHIYHFNKKSVKRQSATISDFYESAVAHPDWVLKDVITILHPSLEFTKGYETIYIDSITTK